MPWTNFPIEKASRFVWRATCNLLCVALWGRNWPTPASARHPFWAYDTDYAIRVSCITVTIVRRRVPGCRQDYGCRPWAKRRDMAADVGAQSLAIWYARDCDFLDVFLHMVVDTDVLRKAALRST